MTPEARTFILKCFCGQVTAVEVAQVVNKTMPKVKGKVTPDQVRAMWEEAAETHPIIRALVDQLGERPPRGYAACEHTRLAEELVAA